MFERGEEGGGEGVFSGEGGVFSGGGGVSGGWRCVQGVVVFFREGCSRGAGGVPGGGVFQGSGCSRGWVFQGVEYTFIQNRFHPLTLSSKHDFIQ